VVVTLVWSAGFRSACIPECGGAGGVEFGYSGALQPAPSWQQSVNYIRNKYLRPTLRSLRCFRVLPALDMLKNTDPLELLKPVSRGLILSAIGLLCLLERELPW